MISRPGWNCHHSIPLLQPAISSMWSWRKDIPSTLWWIMNSFGSVFVRCIRKYSWYLTFLSHTLKRGFGQRNGQPAGMSVCLDTHPSGNCFPLLCLQTSKMCWTHNRCYRDLFSTKQKQLKCLKLNVNCSIRESWKHWTLKARIWNLFQRARAQLRTKTDLKYFTELLWYANKTYLAKSDFLIALIKSLLAPRFQLISSFNLHCFYNQWGFNVTK